MQPGVTNSPSTTTTGPSTPPYTVRTSHTTMMTSSVWTVKVVDDRDTHAVERVGQWNDFNTEVYNSHGYYILLSLNEFHLNE